MPRKRNLFYRIVDNENSFTELFVNILQIDAYRKVLISFFREQLSDQSIDFSFEDITTQMESDGNGRPDIEIKNNNIHILIENKIDRKRELTDNQENNNYQLIFNCSDNSIKHLFYFVPRYYNHKNLIPTISQTSIVEWEDFIEFFKQRVDLKRDIVFDHFTNLCDELFCYKKIELKMEDTEKLITDKSFIKLKGLVDHAYEHLQQQKTCFNIKHICNEAEYCIYIRDNEGKLILYIGIWYKLWEDKNIPLCLLFDETTPKEYKEKYQKEGEIQEYPDGNDIWRSIPFNLTENNTTEKIQALIDRYLK